MHVRDIMTPDPIVAEIPGTREDAIQLLTRHRVSGLPVVKARTHEIVGVITRTDLLRRPDEEQIALLMTPKPLVVSPTDDVANVARLFSERRVHGFPVVEHGVLQGVVSPTDVLRAIGSENGHTVKELGIEPAVPVHASTPIRVVWEIMKLAKQNALPILDDRPDLAGIVADSDLFTENQETDARESDRRIPEDAEFGRVVTVPRRARGTRIELPAHPVSKVMIRDVHTIFEGASVADAARKLVRYRINQLPVVDAGDRLSGMVTDFGLMRAAFAQPGAEAVGPSIVHA